MFSPLKLGVFLCGLNTKMSSRNDLRKKYGLELGFRSEGTLTEEKEKEFIADARKKGDISITAEKRCLKCKGNRWVDLWCYYCGSLYPQGN